MTYKAAIFDLDGTLLNTLDDLADSCNRVLAGMGFPTLPVQEYKHLVGRGIAHLVKTAIHGHSVTDAVVEQMTAEMKADYSHHCMEKTQPYPGITGTLIELDARGIIMSVLSNKPRKITEYLVIKLLPRFRLNTVMGGDNRFPRKPDPESTLYLIDQMQIPPEKTVFIGDSEIDILTAKNAGIDSIAVMWGFRTVDELESAGAKVIIHDPAELLEFFK